MQAAQERGVAQDHVERRASGQEEAEEEPEEEDAAVERAEVRGGTAWLGAQPCEEEDDEYDGRVVVALPCSECGDDVQGGDTGRSPESFVRCVSDEQLPTTACRPQSLEDAGATSVASAGEGAAEADEG